MNPTNPTGQDALRELTIEMNRLSMELATAESAAFNDLAAAIAMWARRLHAASDHALEEGGAGAIANIGVQTGKMAVRLDIAEKALRTALVHAGNDNPLQHDIAAINRAVAQSCVLAALESVARLVSARATLPAWAPGAGAQAGETPPPVTKTSDVTPQWQLNIAHYHRQHERYYVQERASLAADLHKEAVKLKTLAQAWGTTRPIQPDASIDFSDQAYAPVGCPDLNVLPAIGMIGVLFMEGDKEPLEIKVLKAKLSGLAGDWRRAGQWLLEKMAAAWDREQAMYHASLIDIAHPRFATIVNNWCGAAERLLAARTLEACLRVLDDIPFEPARLRQDLPVYGRKLYEAGSIISTVAQLVGRTAANLAENDESWTTCIRHLNGLSRLPSDGPAAPPPA